MERVRQEIYLRTSVSGEYSLTKERAQECLKHVVATTTHEPEQPPPVILVLQLDGVLYLRHKANDEIMIAIKSGDVAQVNSASDDAPAPTGEHVIHFVSEPRTLAADASASGGMCGFLTFSIAVQLDESAVAPLTTGLTSHIPLPNDALSNRPSWERGWFVLKRPFLYEYKSFARQEQIGVADVLKWELVDGRLQSGGDSSFPLCIQLISNCAVWSLQAATHAELDAWLVAIQPIKMKTREAVESAKCPSDAVA